MELYDADPSRIEVVPPGVDREMFHPGGPGAKALARAQLGLTGKVLLFAGRVQPLKGLDLAVRTLAALERTDTTLVVVGGASGPDGEAELARMRTLVADLGISGRVRFVAPQAHRQLATYYRAADVCLVPSRSESFGLVALEAAACGTPVVASDVGGLSVIVHPGETGYLVEDRTAAAFAVPVAALLADDDLAALDGRRGRPPGARLRVERHRCEIQKARGRPRGARTYVVSMSGLPDFEAAFSLVRDHLEGPVADADWVQHVEFDPELRRWYVRFGCDGRDAATIYFDLYERTLRYELYFLPDSGENHEALWGWLLRRNHSTYAARFSLGPDGDVYLVGRVPLEHLTIDELDRVIGELYELTELWFQTAIGLAYRRQPDATHT